MFQVVTERNLLDKQIINRDIELKGLYEKLKLQTSVMGKGEKSYAEREAEAEEMKGRVKELIQERNMLRKKGDGAKSIKFVININNSLLWLIFNLNDSQKQTPPPPPPRTKKTHINLHRKYTPTEINPNFKFEL